MIDTPKVLSPLEVAMSEHDRLASIVHALEQENRELREHAEPCRSCGEMESQINRLLAAGRELLTALRGAAAFGTASNPGWSRADISRLAQHLAEKYPELDPARPTASDQEAKSV